MAAMASLFLQTPVSTRYSPKTLKTQFVQPFNLSLSPRVSSRARPRTRVSCALIQPDGGRLVELFVEESEREVKKNQALGLPQIKLSKIDLQWLHVLSEGWASPLRGYMREREFLQTLHFNSLRLEDGSFVNMSVPIVLAIDDAQKSRIGGSSSVALVDDGDRTIAILNE